ncbi:hypothetical protein RHMOL_Rhmol09G0126000 [Rhododendron molle]|uniref:Uncharacterized protein n=1 Tax=Rhododendron molle TaxID=49168 RepID=A0ACC0MCL8_RHOML|nr:hypothetical protein RHMOL_Rhmol09G0126000 [Rhododendron molle]
MVVDQKCVEGGGAEDGEEAVGVLVDENAKEGGVGGREGWSPRKEELGVGRGGRRGRRVALTEVSEMERRVG